MIVLKFGGTSLADIDEIRRVLDIIEERVKRQPVVVVSALGEITDVLERLARLSLEKTEREIIDEVNDYFEPRLYRIVSGVIPDDTEQRKCLTEINRLLQELKNIYRGLLIVRELTPRALDRVLSYGELFSQNIINHALNSRDVPAVRMPADKCLITDAHFGSAQVKWAETTRAITDRLLPAIEQDKIPILQGFVGGTQDGSLTTLGRGGSDYTAAVIGAVCEAEEIQIWTDVDGFLNADPSLVSQAITIPELNINEARELAQFGARVLHPKTVLPAIERDIPVYIKNTFAPDNPGTRLCRDRTGEGIHGMTVLRNLAKLTFEWNRSSDSTGEQLDELTRHEDVVISFSMSNSLILYLPEQGATPGADDLPQEVSFTRESGMNLIAVVGENLTAQSRSYSRLIELLDGYNYDLITLSPQKNRWLIPVRGKEVEEIFTKLYDGIFTGEQHEVQL